METKELLIRIPPDVQFRDLKLARDSDGGVSFDVRVIERICAASGLPASVYLESKEDNVAGLLVSWYQAHRQMGGERDPVAEDLLAEVQLEDRAGQGASLPPGRA